LRAAIVRAGAGLIDADLGSGLIKQRVARTGKGRSGGNRMLVAYREGDKAIFVYDLRRVTETISLLTNLRRGAKWRLIGLTRMMTAWRKQYWTAV
jgi:hypothetical protein